MRVRQQQLEGDVKAVKDPSKDAASAALSLHQAVMDSKAPGWARLKGRIKHFVLCLQFQYPAAGN